MHFLITRPIDQAIGTASKLKTLGHSCLIDPMMKIQNTNIKFPDGSFNAIIISSANALLPLNAHWPKTGRSAIPVLVTGNATQRAAQKFGFSDCTKVNGSAKDLAARVPHWAPKNANILYPCAKIVALDLSKIIPCTPWPAYAAKPSKKLSDETKSALKAGLIDVILLYSARTAKTFTSLWQKSEFDSSNLQILALSKEICADLPPQLGGNCIYPLSPNEDELFKMIPTPPSPSSTRRQNNHE